MNFEFQMGSDQHPLKVFINILGIRVINECVMRRNFIANQELEYNICTFL